MSERARSKYVSFRVTDKEREMITRKMEQAGISSLRAYMLKMSVDGYVVQLDLSGVREMVKLLKSVSTNMNQIAKRANETSNIYEADIQDLQARYDKLWECAGGILKKLSEL